PTWERFPSEESISRRRRSAKAVDQKEIRGVTVMRVDADLPIRGEEDVADGAPGETAHRRDLFPKLPPPGGGVEAIDLRRDQSLGARGLVIAANIEKPVLGPLRRLLAALEPLDLLYFPGFGRIEVKVVTGGSPANETTVAGNDGPAHIFGADRTRGPWLQIVNIEPSCTPLFAAHAEDTLAIRKEPHAARRDDTAEVDRPRRPRPGRHEREPVRRSVLYDPFAVRRKRGKESFAHAFRLGAIGL